MTEKKVFTREQALEKVYKALKLATSNVPAEAESALLHAQRLMAKYHISMADVTNMEGDAKAEKVIQTRVEGINLARPWVRKLARVVAKNFRCVNFMSGYGNSWNCVLMGYETDVKVAVEVFRNSQKYVERKGENLAQRYSDRGQSSRGVKTSFCVGFVDGLEKAYEEQIRKSEELSLMVVAPQEAVDYKASLGSVSLGFQQHYSMGSDYRAGYETGYDYGNQRSLEEDDTK